MQPRNWDEPQFRGDEDPDQPDTLWVWIIDIAIVIMLIVAVILPAL